MCSHMRQAGPWQRILDRPRPMGAEGPWEGCQAVRCRPLAHLFRPAKPSGALHLDLRYERGFCYDCALAITAITTLTPFLAVYLVQIKSGV